MLSSSCPSTLLGPLLRPVGLMSVGSYAAELGELLIGSLLFFLFLFLHRRRWSFSFFAACHELVGFVKCAIHLYKVDFFLSDQLGDSSLGGIVLLQMLAPANTAPQGERALPDIVTCDRVWYLQWAVLAVAILRVFSRSVRVLMAWLAEPSTSMYTTAVIYCNGAAVHALPINVIRTVSLFADIRANAHVLD